jgi:hypothetical protein
VFESRVKQSRGKTIGVAIELSPGNERLAMDGCRSLWELCRYFFPDGAEVPLLNI